MKGNRDSLSLSSVKDGIVYLITPRNEVGSEIKTFQNEDEAVNFFLAKVAEEKNVADKYASIGLSWPPPPV